MRCPVEDLSAAQKAWRTRRRNAFQRAVRDLIEGREMLQAAQRVSDYLATALPSNTPLPRGYSLRANCYGEASLALEDTLFSPGCLDPLPEQGSLQQLARDLATGLLREIREATKGAEA
jgi:hypothetical protein